MPGTVPQVVFRIEPGYTIQEPPLDLPQWEEGDLLVGGTTEEGSVNACCLGRVAEYQSMRDKVWLDTNGAHAVYIMGKRRSGKTFTLGVLAESLACAGWARQGPTAGQAVLLVDTMNVFMTMPLLVPDVYEPESGESTELRQWRIEPENLNVRLFHPHGTTPPPEVVSDHIAIRPSDLNAEDWAAIFEVDTFSDPMGQLISEVHEKVAIEGYQGNGGTQVPPNPEFSLEDLLSCLADDLEIQRFETRTIEGVRRRLRALNRLSIFSTSGVSIKDLFVSGQVSVLMLRDLDHVLRSLLVGIIVKKSMELRSTSDSLERMAAINLARAKTNEDKDPTGAKDASDAYVELTKRAAVEGIPRSWILVDEAHNYIPTTGIVASKEPLKKYINEGRNLGLSIAVATQQPSGLDGSIRRNADILIIHSMTMRDDIQAAEGMINTIVPDSVTVGSSQKLNNRVFERLLRSLPRGYAVISNDEASRLFVTKIRPRFTVHGGREY